jgi:hypothetical protein
MALLPLIRNGVVALVVIALLLSSSWRCCPHCNGIFVIIDVIALVAHWQAGIAAVDAQVSLPLLQWQMLLSHDGVIAVFDAQACLHHCQASVVALTACCQASGVTHISMVLVPLMRRVFAIVAIAFFPLTTMASLPLAMHRCLCHCGDGVFALVTMALLPLGSRISCPALPDLWKKGRIIGKFGEILIRQTKFTHVKNAG